MSTRLSIDVFDLSESFHFIYIASKTIIFTLHAGPILINSVRGIRRGISYDRSFVNKKYIFMKFWNELLSSVNRQEKKSFSLAIQIGDNFRPISRD